MIPFILLEFMSPYGEHFVEIRRLEFWLNSVLMADYESFFSVLMVKVGVGSRKIEWLFRFHIIAVQNTGEISI